MACVEINWVCHPRVPSLAWFKGTPQGHDPIQNLIYDETTLCVPLSWGGGATKPPPLIDVKVSPRATRSMSGTPPAGPRSSSERWRGPSTRAPRLEARLPSEAGKEPSKRPGNTEASNKLVKKQAGRQAGKQASRQAGRQAGN